MQDIHTHLYWESYDSDRDAVIARAREAGVKEMFVVGCTIEESRQCVALADQYEDIYASVGIHPHEFNDVGFKIDDVRMEELRALAKHEKVVAIGECGLDYFAHGAEKITSEQKTVQKQGFLAQIALAEELHLPLILHCRASVGTQDAYEDLFRILSEANVSAGWRIQTILHCYMGDTEVTKKFLTLPNVYFSFTGNITYPVKKAFVGTKDDLTETVKLIPLDRIFAETDCPFLAPQLHRGERNEPVYMKETVVFLAQLRGQEENTLMQYLEKNFHNFFKSIPQ